MKSWPTISGELSEYVDNTWLRDSPLKRRLREETAGLPQAGMQISAHQGQQMALLARAIGAKRAVDDAMVAAHRERHAMAHDDLVAIVHYRDLCDPANSENETLRRIDDGGKTVDAHAAKI